MEYHDGNTARVLGFIAKTDRRILTECVEQLPRQIFLCRYLATAIRSHNGTVRVAREMCKLLAPYASAAPMVLGEATLRLGIHDEDDKHRRRLSQALSHRAQEICEQILILRIRLIRGKSNLPPNTDPIARYMDGGPLDGSNPDPNAVEAFQCIFLCAIAMLVGVDIDPRVPDAT